MKKIREIITPENVLSLFIIMCPVLDILSFLFRKKFSTNYSISTLIRPIIPAIMSIYLFLKHENKRKIKIVILAIIYTVYAVAHLYIYNKSIVDCSYGTLMHEAQYIVNYSFMIMNLFIYKDVFNNDNIVKLRKAVTISMVIYIVSIYIAIITKTSSTTYIEGIGFKGWFESGNSISAILLLGVVITLSFIMKVHNRKAKSVCFITLGLIGIYLTTLIGTRVGLLGFVIVIVCFIISQIYEKIVLKIKIDAKVLGIVISILTLLVVLVAIAGSVTLNRRQHLKNMEVTIKDESTGEVSHLTGDLTCIKNQIVDGSLSEHFMTDAQKKSIIDLYNKSKDLNISNTDTRRQQLIYHIMLIKNQRNIVLILFGNGYLINTNELVLEMELPSILMNFGIIGFILYMLPFIAIFIKSIVIFAKNRKMIDTESIMLISGAGLSFILSTLSGYTFFNSSSMMIIIVINVLLNSKTKELRG